MSSWSPHPLHRPGILLAGALIVAGGIGLGVFALTGFFLPAGIIGHIVAFLFAVLFLMIALVPPGHRRRRAFLMGSVLVLGVAGLLLLWWTDPLPPPGLVPGALLLVVGLGLVFQSERKRCNLQATLEDDQVRLEAKRQQILHTLPLDRVRDVQVKRTIWGRLWGHGDLVARVRKGTMKGHINQPLVAETPADDPLMQNGWDEEERFHIKAVHPYKRIKGELEEKIRMARLPPQEREEARLADRLTRDLGELEV